MSYLAPARMIFAGQFQADPSTVNNDPEHFDSERFRSSYQLPGQGATNGWWNPRGTGAWRFRGCSVKRVVYADGTYCDDPNVEPVIGNAINDAEARVEGKLVDLDPEQQMVSEIWGFSILLGDGVRLRGHFEPSPFADIWTRFPKGQPDSFFGAFYQGTLNVESFGGGNESRIMKELSSDNALPKKLSVKFNVDGFNDDSTSPLFTFGRVVGSIGLYLPGEPHHFVAGRTLQPTPPNSPLNTAYAQLDGDLLSIDLGNSLPTTSPGGPLVDQSRLWVALLPLDPNAQPNLLHEIDYRAPGWYEQTAGIVTFRLSPAQLQQAANTPLGIVQSSSQGLQPLLNESPDGSFLRADKFVFRMNPGEKESTTFYATSFGQRAPNQQISLAYDNSQFLGQVKQGPVSGPAIVGQPQTAFTFPLTITTGPDGTAVLPIQSADPGNPRVYIDGQLYGVSYGPGSTPPAFGSVQNPSQMLSALVWSGFVAPDTPDWLADIRPVMQQYANLYPVMKPIVDLSDYASLLNKRMILKTVFDAEVSDPNYMPVTRDLSSAKRRMIRQWLDCPLYMQLDTVDDLTLALQQAIELEHATIPPYLCALYSIKDGTNTEVAELIRSVVMEEMLHMALACNLLISIGGRPRIGNSGFVPNYPGSLPGGLRAGLTVRLRRCSIAQIRDVFLPIEQPEKVLEPVRKAVNAHDPLDASLFTIGWFYDEIAKSLEKLSEAGKISFGNLDRQVTTWHGTGTLYAVGSLEDAKKAIHEIKHQGEGCAPRHPGDADHELAHYYKFAEIVAGRHLVPTEGGFAYTGAPIAFDPEGVWPMMDDPDIAFYPPGSRAHILAGQFAETYQALLNGLNRVFNGDPAYLGQTVGLMYSLSLAARQLMQTPSGLNDGTTAGPSFQLPFPR